MSNEHQLTPKHSRFVVAVLFALVLVAAACGGSSANDAAAEGPVASTSAPPSAEPTATTEAAPAVTEPVSTTVSQEQVSSEDEIDEDDLELGYLAAEDVDAYIARYESALESSYLSIDGAQEALLTASPEEVFTLTSASNDLILLLGDNGIDGAQLFFDGEPWELDSAPQYGAVPDELDEEDGEGDILEVSFSVVNVDDATVTAEVELRLDVIMVGAGDSVIETRDNYALISGTLGTSTYIQIRDIIADQPEVDTLVLTSVRGSENDEINVHTARLIRDAGWTTWVPANGDISSGGVDMFAAGVERFIEPGGFAGVHSWSDGDGEIVGSGLPPDHPAHRSQLEYFSEMLGEEAGPEFYFYALEASPAASIYRMTPAEIVTYGLTTGEPEAPLSGDIVGEFGAGYLEILDGNYLKMIVESCDFDSDSGEADLLNPDLGEAAIVVVDGVGQLSFTNLDTELADHTISELAVVDGSLTATVDLNFELLLDGDTSEAQLAIPCTG